MGLLDLFFPKRCVGCKAVGDFVCGNCFATISFDVEQICVVCNRPSIDGRTHPVCLKRYAIDGSFCAVKYRGVVKKLVYTFKYQPYLSGLTEFLGDLFSESLLQHQPMMEVLAKNPIFIPIPLSKKKLRERGYNQAELLSKNLGKKFGLQVVDYLVRRKETKPQFGLKREERIENMKGAFAINSKFRVQNSELEKVDSRLRGNDPSTPARNTSQREAGGALRVNNKTAILVDDVLTTGSTLSEAANTLKRNGFEKVYGICLARD